MTLDILNILGYVNINTLHNNNNTSLHIINYNSSKNTKNEFTLHLNKLYCCQHVDLSSPSIETPVQQLAVLDFKVRVLSDYNPITKTRIYTQHAKYNFANTYFSMVNEAKQNCVCISQLGKPLTF